MWFGPFDHVFKRYWGVGLEGQFAGFLVANFDVAHVDYGWEQLVFGGVDDGVGVDGDQEFVAFAVDSNAVVIILVSVRGETYENIL